MTVATVKLWGSNVATVYFDRTTGIGSFEYDRKFLSSNIQLAPITMPLSDTVYSFPALVNTSFHGLPGLIADSLPDKFGNAVIDTWLARQGRSSESFDPVERLCYTGKRGMGALEYYPTLKPSVSNRNESVHIDMLVQLASDILNKRESIHLQDKNITDIIKVGTSAGGARAKAVIAYNPVTGDVRSGQIQAGSGYQYWLIKFDGIENNRDREDADDPQYTRIEYAYHLMALSAGIQMNECILFEDNGHYHFMTKRFDRDPVTGEKIHMQTLSAMAHVDFNQAGLFSYEQIGEVLRKIKAPASDMNQLYGRMVFNIMAKNHDDHVKNTSFLMNKKGQWSLAPAYDITYSYNPNGFWTKSHQMSINGKRDDFTKEDLLASADNMGIKRREALLWIDRVENALNQWPDISNQAGLSQNVSSRIQKQFIHF